MPLYGFNREHARLLKKVARREGLAPRTGASVKYPQPLADDFSFLIGKPTANITAPGTLTFAIYSGDPGSETATGDEVTAYTYVDLDSTKMCTCTLINGHYYAGCYEP